MIDPESARKREQLVKDAIIVLKKHPDYARAELQKIERLETFIAQYQGNFPAPASNARFEYVLKLLDIQAEAYLLLVTDQGYQDAFVAMLVDWTIRSWEEYLDLPIEAPPIGRKFDEIRTRARQWTKEGLRRLMSRAGSDSPEPQSEPLQQSAPARATRVYREPKTELLDRGETLNRKQAAEALGVSGRQLDRYVVDKLLTPVGGYGRRRFKTKDLLSFMVRKDRDR